MAELPSLKEAVNGTKNTAEDYNENFKKMLEYLHESILEQNTKIIGIQSSTSSAIATMNSTLLPIGAIIMWGSAPVPTGFVAMEGQTDLTAYPNLIALGYTSLPDTRGRFPQGGENNEAFNLVEAGLPNITGTFNGHQLFDSAPYGTGAFGTGGSANRKTPGGGGDSGQGGFNFNASRSSSIYGNSDTVQPPAWTTVFIIRYQ